MRLAVALAAATLLEKLLFDVSPGDPFVYTVVVLAIVGSDCSPLRSRHAGRRWIQSGRLRTESSDELAA
jgi:hypothetical protein